jgi:THO complex subunit 2
VSTPKPGEVEDGEVDDAKHLKNGTAAADTKAAASSVQTPPVPQRSEILIQREKVKAERAAAQANIPTRPDTLRPHTPGSMLDRAPPSLPNRPDAPIPAHNHGDRHRHPERRDDRNPRNIDSVRGERPGDRPREYPAASRRNGESIPRDFGRSTDRGVIPDRERSRPDPPPRWNPDTSRENAERNLNGSRSTDNIGRLSRDHAMAPPRSTAPLIDRGVVGNSDRLSQVNPERQDLIDPGRAALISSDTRSDSPRRHREDARDRPSPRNQSPRRHPSDRDHADSRRDDRSSRTAQADLNTPPRARNEDAGITPVGPRGDRSVERTSERNDRNAFPSTSPVNRPVDPDHGRLNAGIRQQPADPNFGRLNPTPVPDIPSGPRDRQIRGANRVSSGHGLRGDTRTSTDQQIPRPPTPDKQPPTGPSSNRHPRRSTSGQFDNVSHQGGTAPHVAPVGVSAPSVHPDRAKHLPHTPSQQQVPYQQSIQHQQHLPQPPPPTSAPMHPDRLRVLGNDGPNLPVTPVNQMNNNRPRPPMPILNTGGPPSGPKGSQLSPVNSNANGMAPPTGPASAQERAQRGGRRQLAGINNMLQQGGTHNGPINVRGRGRVSAGLQQESPVSVSPNQIPPPPPGPLPGRQGPRNISRDMVDPARADLITGGSEAPTEDREKDRSSRRSGHRSRRSSKSPGRDRESKRGVPEEDRSSRSEYRDRRSGGDRENDRERHQPRTTNLDLIPGGGGGGSGGSREGGREGHSHRESSRHNGRERDLAKEQHDGTWTGSERPPGGRNREPRSDDRRGGGGEGRDNRQSRGDDSRKRRSDEGTIDPRGHDKRPRRM